MQREPVCVSYVYTDSVAEVYIIGALFGGPLYYLYNKEPPNSIDNH